MPELRKDPIVNRWVIIATERARRPGNFVERMEPANAQSAKECAFCKPKEKIIYSASRSKQLSFTRRWDVCVVPFKDSFLATDNQMNRQTNGLYDVIEGFGVHEVVIESSDHVADMADLDLRQIQLVFETYAVRMKELEKNKNLQYILAFKNHGPSAGSRNIGHSRSHIMATPVNPFRVKDKLKGAKDYFENKKRCVYCDLIQQESNSKSRIVLDTKNFVAITPFAARFLFEVWIIPKAHHCDYYHGITGFEEELAGIMKTLLLKFKIGLDYPAYNYVIQTAPFRRQYHGFAQWKTIEQDFHWHIELTPRLTLMAGFEKGTGFYISAVPPEMTAEYLRDVDLSN